MVHAGLDLRQLGGWTTACLPILDVLGVETPETSRMSSMRRPRD